MPEPGLARSESCNRDVQESPGCEHDPQPVADMANGADGPMNELYLGVASFLLLNVMACMVRVWRGPLPADRMLVSQLFGTTGVAIALLLAEVHDAPAIRSVGMVFAVLAVIATAVFTRRAAGASAVEEPA